MKIVDRSFTKLSPNDIARPWLSVTIINPHSGKKINVLGLIDTGADECALPATYANILGHNLQSGRPKEINTGNGITTAYSHSSQIKVGDFTIDQTLIDFMIVAFAIFMVVKVINRMKKKAEEKPTEPPAPSNEELLLTEIRDLLKQQK